MNCKICNSQSNEIFTAKVLGKYDVKYFQCESCQFIQTEDPHWLAEAYSNAISSLDVGYVTRNITFADLTIKLLMNSFDSKGNCLDYGGGYGMFVRLMRDKGFNFYRQDLYCENLFSKYFDLEDIEQRNDFELVTAFEVFEHLINPLEEIEKMFTYSDSILFSTELQPDKEFKSSDDWWYFVPMGGQHVAIYTKAALSAIANKFDCNLYTNSRNLHLLTKRNFQEDPILDLFQQDPPNFLDRLNNKFNKKEKVIYPESLISSDFEHVKNQLFK